MEPMIILRRQPKDQQRAPSATDHPLRIPPVRVAQQPRDGELAALDPEPGRLGDGLEGHETTVGRADEPVGVVGLFDGACVGFELAVEEFVEGLCSGVRGSGGQAQAGWGDEIGED